MLVVVGGRFTLTSVGFLARIECCSAVGQRDPPDRADFLSLRATTCLIAARPKGCAQLVSQVSLVFSPGRPVTV